MPVRRSVGRRAAEHVRLRRTPDHSRRFRNRPARTPTRSRSPTGAAPRAEHRAGRRGTTTSSSLASATSLVRLCFDLSTGIYVRRAIPLRHDDRGRNPSRGRARRRGLLVCSTGGHLLQLVAVREAWVEHTHVWVTFDKSDARSLLPGRARLLRVRAHEPQREEPRPQPLARLAPRPTVRPRSIVRRRARASAVPFALDRPAARRARRLRRELHAHRAPLAQLPADRARGGPRLRAVAGARPRPSRARATSATSSSTRRDPRHGRDERGAASTDCCWRSTGSAPRRSSRPARTLAPCARRARHCVDYLSFDELTETSAARGS